MAHSFVHHPDIYNNIYIYKFFDCASVNPKLVDNQAIFLVIVSGACTVVSSGLMNSSTVSHSWE